MRNAFSIASSKIAEWEGGASQYNPDTELWTAYPDEISGGVPTLGPGLTGTVGGQDIVAGEEYPSEVINTEFQSRMQGDFNWLKKNVNNWDDLNDNQKASVMSLVHNVGKQGFIESNAFNQLNKGNYKEFLYEAFDPDIGFVKADGEIIKGLQNRRRKERDLFLTEPEAF